MITGIIDPVLRYLFCSPKLVIYYGMENKYTMNIFVADEDAVAVVVLAWWGAK